MIPLPPTVRVFVGLDPVDMRKSFDGLAAQVQRVLGLDPLSGCLFAFTNRRRSLLKVLYFDRSGYTIVYKRLERGTFELPNAVDGAEGTRVEIGPAELALILEGIDLGSAKRRPWMQLRRRQGHLADPSAGVSAPR